MTRVDNARRLAEEILETVKRSPASDAMTALTLVAATLLASEGRPERSNEQLSDTMSRSLLLVLNSMRDDRLATRLQ